MVQRLWRETIDPAVALVPENSRKIGEGAHVAEAPSPWDAFFYLRAQQQYVYRQMLLSRNWCRGLEQWAPLVRMQQLSAMWLKHKSREQAAKFLVGTETF